MNVHIRHIWAETLKCLCIQIRAVCCIANRQVTLHTKTITNLSILVNKVNQKNFIFRTKISIKVIVHQFHIVAVIFFTNFICPLECFFDKLRTKRYSGTWHITGIFLFIRNAINRIPECSLRTSAMHILIYYVISIKNAFALVATGKFQIFLQNMLHHILYKILKTQIHVFFRSILTLVIYNRESFLEEIGRSLLMPQ